MEVPETESMLAFLIFISAANSLILIISFMLEWRRKRKD